VRIISLSNFVISILITCVEEALNVVKMKRLAVIIAVINRLLRQKAAK